MAQKVATPALTEFFIEENQADPNATLRSARDKLQQRRDGPSDDSGETELLLQETEELIEVHEEHCLLADFVPPSVQHGGGRGTHG